MLRLVLPTPGSLAGDFRFDGEREAVADVYDAVAELLDAVGGPSTPCAAGPRSPPPSTTPRTRSPGPGCGAYASSSTERRLHAQYAAALPLAEAATALAWAERGRLRTGSEGPRRLAAAVRGNTHTGPLPAPSRSAPPCAPSTTPSCTPPRRSTRAGAAICTPGRAAAGDHAARRLRYRRTRVRAARRPLLRGQRAAVAQALHHDPVVRAARALVLAARHRRLPRQARPRAARLTGAEPGRRDRPRRSCSSPGSPPYCPGRKG